MKLQIQLRDEQLLKFIFACRVVTIKQILRRHFQGRNRSIGYDRIKLLLDAGYIRRNATSVSGKITTYLQPLPKCWEVIGEKWPFEVDRPHFKSESPEHDIRLTELMMRLERLKGFRSFITENLLQSSSVLADDPRFGDLTKIQSDGALTIIGKNGTPEVYAFELELSKKSFDRYREKLGSYYLARGIDGVLYVSPGSEVPVVLAKVESEIGQHRPPLVWMVLEENALREDRPLHFVNRNGARLEFA